MRCRITVAVVFLFLVLSGCGDANDTVADAGATSVDDSGQTSSPGDSSTLTTAIATESSPIAADADAEMSPENCPLLVAAIGGAANVAAASVTGNPTAELPVANMRALADRIPEISDDLRTLADAYEAFFRKLEELGVDLADPSTIASLDPAAIEEMNAAAEALDEGAVARADSNIQAFFERECS